MCPNSGVMSTSGKIMSESQIASLLLRGIVASLTIFSVSVQAQVSLLSPDYEMEKRFQPDWRNRAAITLPNTTDYAQPKDFLVSLKLGKDPTAATDYTWVLTRGEQTVYATGANPKLRLSAGLWKATVTGKKGTTVAESGSRLIDVKDLLIVAIGDSCGSGEGVPEIPAFFLIDGSYTGSKTMEDLLSSDLNKIQFADFPAVGSLEPVVPESWARSTSAAMTLENLHAHRSTKCYSARYAMALEKANPHLSVTYVNVAQSGAVVGELISQHNTSADDGTTPMPVQLTELKKIVGNRKIDRLLISIGGNDLGFGPLVAKLLASPVIFAGYFTGWDGDFIDPISLAPKIATNPAYAQYIPSPFTTNDFPSVFTSSNAPGIADKILNGISGTTAVRLAFQGLDADITVLASNYKSLNASLRSLFAIDRIAITEYPELYKVHVQGTDGKPVLWWAPGLTDLIPTMAINPSEAMLFSRLYTEPLNRAVSNAAATNNWVCVGGVGNVLAGHGYGAPKDKRWIVTARESLLSEGATPQWYGQVLPLTSFGTSHVNAPGNVATARLVASSFGDTNAANDLSAEVTLNGLAIGSSTLTTPVDLGQGGDTNAFLVSGTTGTGLGIFNVEATGGFSVVSQSNITLPPGGSTTFFIGNPTNGGTGTGTGIVTVNFTDSGVSPYSFRVSAFNGGNSNSGNASADWMSSITNTIPLSRLTLPGTHDTMARYETIYGTAVCQDMNLGEQLTNGVRCLDIRGRHLNNRLVMHHGVEYQKANFDDVLRDSISFLSNHPSETIVMSLKEESTPSRNTRSYEATVKAYLANYPSRYFYNGWNPCTKIPTLGEARGKILLVRRFSGTLGIDAAPPLWPNNPTHVVQVGPLLMVEDFFKQYYSVLDPFNARTYDTKWTAVYDGLLRAQEDTEGKFMHLTYSSGLIMYVIPQIRGLAGNINPRLNGFFSKNPRGSFGAVMMDFPTSEMISKIYRSNL